MNFFSSHNIAINPVGLTGDPAKKYLRDVNEHLTWIYRTVMGKLMLDEIKKNAKPISIEPYTGGYCNALAYQFKGTQIVSYSPNTFTKAAHGPCQIRRKIGNSGSLWDEMLFHEFVHVFRNVTGKSTKKVALTGQLVNFGDIEEFIAVMITNIYISDRSNKIKTSLRAHHDSLAKLGSKFSEPFGFFARGEEVLSLVKKFCEDHPEFSKKVATSLATAKFNPISDYYADSDRAAKVAKEASTLMGLAEIIKEMIRTTEP